MKYMDKYNIEYMRRALQLAAQGFGNTTPNPMVGSVIVSADGRIIGEGYHRKCGEGHAEVNAVASVRESDRAQLHDATMYVTLEPCSHYGKTPPCAKLIIDNKIGRVIVGALDPFDKVSGRGIAMLREAGIDVVTGVLADESKQLNAQFMTAHTLKRPFITLKWAQSADGYIDHRRTADQPAARFSGSLTGSGVHRLRAAHDAILVGSNTIIADRPQLNVRNWQGRNPQPVILDRRQRIDVSNLHFAKEPIIYHCQLSEALADLYARGITSVLVEGGAAVLQSFIDAGMWDAARIERAEFALGERGATPAPKLHKAAIAQYEVNESLITYHSNNPLFTASHPIVAAI
jgi:diaminohydroxyphosphoribosylaminopyrimidine deaminase/5-amino-6-(5-phosphoribosylamino)uracil reductase